MKFTLLEMVQEILASMDSEEVNSISDTVESNQVALLIRSVYYDLAIDLGLPEHETIFELNASGSTTRPVLMTAPDNVAVIREIRYNKQEDGDTTADYVPLTFKPLDEFLTQQNGLREDDDATQMTFTVNSESFETMYKSDVHPTCYTTPDDYTFLFDSYQSDVDTTLQKSKTMVFGVVYPTFTLSDNFTPDLDVTQFSLLKNRAKVRAFAELKQTDNKEASGEARRQKIIVQKRKRTAPDVSPLEKFPKYGRKGMSFNYIQKSQKQGW